MNEIIGAAPGRASGGLIQDVSIETFERDVLEASMARPVIVDFWATWCGPCRTLTPMLEKAVMAAGGAVALAKIDIDKNQMLASQMRIQSVPTVYAFFQGRPVDGFQGAIPESEVKAFLARLSDLAGQGSGGAEIEAVIEGADAALEEGRHAEAAEAYAAIAQALEAESDAEASKLRLRAVLGLAKCHLALRDADRARAVFDTLSETEQGDPAAAGVKAALALAKPGVDLAALERLRAAADRAPEDQAARFALAEALVGAGDMEAGIAELLALIAQDREWNEGAARKKLLQTFEALGPAHPDTLKGRRRLSSILFA